MQSHELPPGSTLGGYTIVRKLADGGMAEIYLAQKADSPWGENLVVLKRIRPSIAEDRAQLGMFLDEARLAATLRHANIAEVLDVGSVDSSWFFAMEYIRGQDARTVRLAVEEAQRLIPIEIALAIVAGTAAALAYAHDKTGPDGPLGLVHRDVSPSNILVSYDGAIKLVDFGIARAANRSTKTLTGILKGKVPYMSPEQIRGKVLDRRSDLFSLGSTLYELTTGMRPFGAASDYDTLEQIATGTPTPPSVVDPDYPPALEALVLRLLDRDPDRRYQTAGSLLEDLGRLPAELGVVVTTEGVSTFMRELFAEDAAMRAVPESSADHEPPFIMEVATWTPRDEEATAAVESRVKRYSEPMRKRLATEIDPMAQFRAELLAELEVDSPENEANNTRIRRRIDTLVDRAFACYGANELEMAVAAAELAMNEDGGSAVAQRIAYRHRDTIKAIFEAFIGDPGQVPRLVRPREELEIRPQLQFCSPLMARIDGEVSVQQLLHTSEQSPVETYRQLCALIVNSAVELDP